MSQVSAFTTLEEIDAAYPRVELAKEEGGTALSIWPSVARHCFALLCSKDQECMVLREVSYRPYTNYNGMVWHPSVDARFIQSLNRIRSHVQHVLIKSQDFAALVENRPQQDSPAVKVTTQLHDPYELIRHRIIASGPNYTDSDREEDITELCGLISAMIATYFHELMHLILLVVRWCAGISSHMLTVLARSIQKHPYSSIPERAYGRFGKLRIEGRGQSRDTIEDVIMGGTTMPIMHRVSHILAPCLHTDPSDQSHVGLYWFGRVTPWIYTLVGEE